MPEIRADKIIPKVLGSVEIAGGTTLITMAAGVAFKGEELVQFSPLGISMGRFIENFMLSTTMPPSYMAITFALTGISAVVMGFYIVANR